MERQASCSALKGARDVQATLDDLAHHQRRTSAWLTIAAIIAGSCACIPALAIATDEALIANGYYYGATQAPYGVAPDVFAATGTISIIVNDMREPQGRIYFGGFLISAILMLVAQHTFWLYRSWPHPSSVHSQAAQAGHERTVKMMGYVMPPCLLALCAIVVTPQDMTGHRFYIFSSVTHNIGFLGFGASQIAFEMCQLHIGEQVSLSTFCAGGGALDQRIRFIMHCIGKLCLIAFMSLSYRIRKVEPDVTLAALAVWAEVGVLAPVWFGVLCTAIHTLQVSGAKTLGRTPAWPPPKPWSLDGDEYSQLLMPSPLPSPSRSVSNRTTPATAPAGDLAA